MTQLTATTQPIEQKRKLYMNTVKTVNIPQLEKKKKVLFSKKCQLGSSKYTLDVLIFSFFHKSCST